MAQDESDGMPSSPVLHIRRRPDQIRLRDTRQLRRRSPLPPGPEPESRQSPTERARGRGPIIKGEDGEGSRARRARRRDGTLRAMECCVCVCARWTRTRGNIEHQHRLPSAPDLVGHVVWVQLQGEVLLDVVEGVGEAAEEARWRFLVDGGLALFEAV